MSIKKVASIAGVSIATVSRFFNSPDKVSQSTREKVSRAIEQIDYSPNTLAQNLRRGKTGLIIAVVDKLSSPFYSAVIDHLSTYANDKGYTLLSQQTQADKPLSLEDYDHMVRSKQADGFILLTNFPEQQYKTRLEKKPAIVLACEVPEKSHNNERVSVGIDDFKAAYEATEYLIEQGHKKIAFIESCRSTTAAKQRHLGYLAATKIHRSQPSSSQLQALNSHNFLHEKLDYLFAQADRPTALFCVDDEVAIKALHYLKKKSLRVPEDISLMGFNNSPYSALTDPPLTTVEAPAKDIAASAFDCLLTLMDENQTPPFHRIIEHKLIERDSTKPRNY